MSRLDYLAPFLLLGKLVLLTKDPCFISFSEEVPVEAQHPAGMTDGCGGFDCQKHCIGPADVNWPQAVGSGVLKIVLHTEANKDSLGQVTTAPL